MALATNKKNYYRNLNVKASITKKWAALPKVSRNLRYKKVNLFRQKRTKENFGVKT